MPSSSGRGLGWVLVATLGACSTESSVVPARMPEPVSLPRLSAATAPPPAVVEVAAASPLSACGIVEVEDHSVPPSDARVTVVREATRQHLATLAACSRPYRLHVNVKVEQVGAGRLRVRLRAVVYRVAGEMVADIPTTLSADHADSEQRVSAEEDLLRSGAERTALLFAEHFR